MTLEELHIDAFGRFEAFDLKLGPGLNVLYGANEAGKSTLLSFVRAILFGFEKRKAAARYQPADAQPSGYVQLTTRMGRLRIQRKAGRRQEGDLSVFGADGEQLATDKLVEALAGVSRELFFEVFAFGLSELSTFERLAKESSVSEALFAAGVQGAKRFPEAMDRLRKSTETLYSQRGKKPLNAVLTELAAVQEQLRNLGNRPDEYFELVRQAKGIDGQLEELDQKILALQSQQASQRRLLQNISRLEQLDADAKRFASLESFADFPEAAETLLEERLRAAAAAEEEQKQADRDIAAIHQELARSYAQGQGSPGAEGNAGASAEAESSARAHSSHRRLIELREQWTQAQQGLTSLEAKLAAARKERERVEEAIRRQTTEQQQLPGTPLEDLQRMLGVARRVPGFEAELRTLESIRAEKEQAAVDLRRAERIPPELGFKPVAFLASIAAALGIGALSFLLEGAAFYLGVGFGGFLGLGLYWVRRRAVDTHAAALSQYSEQERGRAARLTQVAGEIASTEARQRQIQAALGESLSDLGLRGDASAEDLLNREKSIESDVKRVEKRIQLSRELEKVTAELASAVRSEKNAQADKNVGEAWLSRLKRELEGFLEREGFATNLSMEEAFEAWRSRAESRGRLAMLEAPQERAQAVAEKAKRALEELLQLGRAASVEDFRTRAQQAQRWRQERIRLQELEHQLEGAAGMPLLELRRKVEGDANAEGLRQAAERIDAETLEAVAQKRQLAEDLGGIRQKSAEWEKDEEAAKLRAQEEALRAKAFQLAERYAVDLLAMKLLTQAKEEFHAHYQPELIQRASGVFSELTAGRYSHILLEPGESELVVREREGAQRKADALSRGTREQLYLAFRIAVIEDFSHRLCPLPVLLDDIWVNFDRKRTEAAVRVFARLAQSQQVIAFTCHEHIRDRFRHHGALCTELAAKQQMFLRLHSA